MLERGSIPSRGIGSLPPELLVSVIRYLPTERDVRNFGGTCRQLRSFIQEQGWKIWVQTHFPTFQPPAIWEPVASELAALSQNLDTKAITLQYLEPTNQTTLVPPDWPDYKWPVSEKRQTIGYRAVLDSYEEWTSGAWRSRREVLAWGAGPATHFRVRELDSRSDKRKRNLCRWYRFKPPNAVDGRDDTTWLKLLGPTGRNFGIQSSDKVLIGTAAGDLTISSFSFERNSNSSHATILANFDTGKRPLLDGDLSPAGDGTFAVLLGSADIALYRTPDEKISGVKPSSQTTSSQNSKDSRLWCCKFFSEDRIAASGGQSTHPINIYQVTPSGFCESPVNSWEFKGRLSPQGMPLTTETCYAMEPIPQPLASSTNIFASGLRDGTVSLHDLRLPGLRGTRLYDLLPGPVYSLCSIDAHSLLVGLGHNPHITMLDLRMPGTRIYDWKDALSDDQRSSLKSQRTKPPSIIRDVGDLPNKADSVIGASYLDLHAAATRAAGSRARSTLPIYCLSRPSSISATVFVGLQNGTAQLDFQASKDLGWDSFCRGYPRYDLRRRPPVEFKNIVSLSMGQRRFDQPEMWYWNQLDAQSYRNEENTIVGGLDMRWDN